MAIKNLILIRHSYAKAQSEKGDFYRELSNLGVEKLSRLTSQLAVVPKPEILLHSSAVRTTQTANKLNEYFKLGLQQTHASKTLYNGIADEYIDELRTYSANVSTLALVGHNPTISYLTQFLCKSFNQGYNPGDLVWLGVNGEGWVFENDSMGLELIVSE